MLLLPADFPSCFNMSSVSQEILISKPSQHINLLQVENKLLTALSINKINKYLLCFWTDFGEIANPIFLWVGANFYIK